jgi:hypothetical protein
LEPLPLPDPVPLPVPEPLPDPLPDLLEVPLFFVLSSVELEPAPELLDPDVVVPLAEPLPLVVPVAEPLPLVVPVWLPDDVLLLLLSEQPHAPRPMAPDKMAAVSRYRSFLILPPLSALTYRALTPNRCAPALLCNGGASNVRRESVGVITGLFSFSLNYVGQYFTRVGISLQAKGSNARASSH